MGDEADFFDREGVASPKVVEALTDLPNPPSDPDLLARLIDGIAGIDLDLSIVGFEADRRSARNEAFEVLRQIKSDACLLIAIQDRHRSLNLLEIVTDDILSSVDPTNSNSEIVAQLTSAIATLSKVELPPNLSSFAIKPVSDEAIERVVLAVATYFGRLGVKFSGAPRRTQTSKGVQYPLHSEPAKLTAAVLSILDIHIDGAALATYMIKARTALTQV